MSENKDTTRLNKDAVVMWPTSRRRKLLDVRELSRVTYCRCRCRRRRGCDVALIGMLEGWISKREQPQMGSLVLSCARDKAVIFLIGFLSGCIQLLVLCALNFQLFNLTLLLSSG